MAETVVPLPGGSGPASCRTPDFLWRPGPGGPQLRLYLADTPGGRPHLQPVDVTVGGRR